MKRRTFIENSLLASAGLSVIPEGPFHEKGGPPIVEATESKYESSWHLQPDRIWAGPELWANRLQDWHLVNGGLECNVRGQNRSVSLLSHELGKQNGSFTVSVNFRFLNPASEKDFIGFRLGSKGPIDDYRSAAIYGKGVNAGLSADGKWNWNNETLGAAADKSILTKMLTLEVEGLPDTTSNYKISLRILDGQTTLSELKGLTIDAKSLVGGIALVSSADTKQQQEFTPSARFENWEVKGTKINEDHSRQYGPIYFAQYTLHNQTVKLSAFCAPGHANQQLTLQLSENEAWTDAATSPVDSVSRVAAFRVANWVKKTPVKYRLLYTSGNKDGRTSDFYYEGTIATAPSVDKPVKLGLFSCNCDHGFPDNDLRQHILTHNIDAALFLGDQFYESSGGFGVEATTLERSILDYSRKWQQFGWSYRDTFRHVPCITIPDDHDVYHGNVWGEGGKAAVPEGPAYLRQDSGGYKMHPDWVRMVEHTQCSHLPDPHDPTPVKQGISVYYTSWNWGPFSFAIIEDRKFKSAPQHIFPKEAGIQNGFITNLNFNDDRYLSAPQAELLGPRQEKFLEEWAADWRHGAQMKILLSQTNFCTLATLPKNSTGDQAVPTLPIPKLGDYVTGDTPTRDMDSNGWPHSKRNKAVDIIRRAFTLHLAGDQHIASVIRYGVDTHDDGGFAFAGPALNNIFPRRWWPTLPADHQPLPDRPTYTGQFEDGFKNKITVHAAASPRLTGLKPAIVHDRATGYGIVKISAEKREITFECWKRSADPMQQSADGQYDGWPITIHQNDNYGRKPYGYLPDIEVSGHPDAVVQVIDEVTKTIEYTLRIKGNTFRPPVFANRKYTLRVGEPDLDRWKEFKGLRPGRKNKSIEVSLA